MAKKDRMRVGMELATDRIFRALGMLEETIPRGPDRVEMTPSELKQSLRNAKGDTLLQFIDVLGIDTIREILQEREDATQRP